MSKEVTNPESTEVAVPSMDAFGEAPVSASDVIIPKILVMQGLSKLVIEGVAKFGDFVDSVSREILGNINEKSIEFIPFHIDKVWIISKWNGAKYEFEKIEDVTAMNENRPWEVETAEGKFKNEKCFNVYALLPEDMSLPYVISFKSTSQKTGREIATQMYIKNRAAGLNQVAKAMTLSGIRETKNNNTFAVFKSAVSRPTTPEEQKAAYEWFTTIKSGAAKADDSDLQPQNAEAAYVDDNANF